MGTSPAGFASPIPDNPWSKPSRPERGNEGEDHPPAREPPPGRGAVIEHRTDELPRRKPYVPRSQRE